MQQISDDEAAKLLVAASGKLTVLAQMLPRLIADNHRVLIFCQFKDVRPPDHSPEGKCIAEDNQEVPQDLRVDRVCNVLSDGLDIGDPADWKF